MVLVVVIVRAVIRFMMIVMIIRIVILVVPDIQLMILIIVMAVQIVAAKGVAAQIQGSRLRGPNFVVECFFFFFAAESFRLRDFRV